MKRSNKKGELGKEELERREEENTAEKRRKRAVEKKIKSE